MRLYLVGDDIVNVVAKINEVLITQEMLDRAVGRYIIQLEEDEDIDFKPTKENYKFIRTEVLNFLIERILLLNRAEREGIQISDDAVSKSIKTLKKNFSSSEEWSKNLLALSTDEASLFFEIRSDMIIEKFIDKMLGDKVKFGEKELMSYYENNEDIMKDPDLFTFYELNANTADDIKIAYSLLQKIEDFTELEKELIKHEINIHNHKNVPGFELSKELQNVLSDLKIGSIATMQGAEGGMMIYKLMKIIRGRKLDYNEIKEKLAEYLIKTAKKETIDSVITDEMEKARIEYLDLSYLEKK